MDHKRIVNAAMGKRGKNLEARLNRRVRVYSVVAVILALFYMFGGDQSVSHRERATTSMAPVDVPIEVPPLASVDPALLTGVADGRAAQRAQLELAPLRHLMLQAGRLVYGDLPKLGLQPGDWQTLAAGGQDELRGQPFWTLGTLQWVEQELVDGYLEVRGEVHDQDGKPWGFVVVNEPYDLVRGSVVKLAGFYLKAYDLLRPDGSVERVPLLIGDELIGSAFPLEPVTTLAPDAFDSVRDSSLAESSAALDSVPFWTLLSYVQHTPVEVLFPPDEPLPERMPTELLARPWAHRAEPVTLTGVLYYMTEVPLGPRGENPLGVPFGWDLWMTDNRAAGAGTILAKLLERPEGVKAGDIIEVDALFFRRYSFENKRNQPRMVSVVVGKRARKLVPKPDTLTPTLMRVVTGMVGVIVALIALGQWRDRRAGRSARTARMRRHQGNVARPGQLHPTGTSDKSDKSDKSGESGDGGPLSHEDQPEPGDDA